MTTVLVAGEKLSVGFDLMFMLEKLGFTVPAVVGSADQAIAGAQTLHPDVVLMDIDLRGPRDGVDTAKEIHAQTRIPIVFYVPAPDDVSIARLREAPMFALLSLPMDEKLLNETLKRAAIASQARPKKSGAVPRFAGRLDEEEAKKSSG